MGVFISFEGPDGSGKSTQARLLATALGDQGYAVTETREPGGTPLGERLRELILDPKSPPATPLVMALMLSASRAQLVETVIKPALTRGDTVIVDRWADSTAAYQGYGLGLSLDTIQTLREIATGALEPDLTVLVDIAPAVGLERMDARGARNRLDAQSLQFHQRVREGYVALCVRDPERWIRVNGDASPDAVHCSIMEQVMPRLARVRRT